MLVGDEAPVAGVRVELVSEPVPPVALMLGVLNVSVFDALAELLTAVPLLGLSAVFADGPSVTFVPVVSLLEPADADE